LQSENRVSLSSALGKGRYLETLLKISPLLNVSASIILVIVTGIYVYLTKRILEATKQQSQLSLAPAIEVLLDSEVEYRHTNISGEKFIPSRFEPNKIPFIKPSETLDKYHPSFGNKFITHFFDEVRESSRLNIHRIETNPTQEPYKESRLYVYCYYKNTFGQFFKSSYSIEIGLDPSSDNPFPKDDETCEVVMYYIPRPSFHIEPISIKKMEDEIQKRNLKRDLSGW
jgi:hypothetical protein